MPNFSTAFAPPPPLTGLVLDASSGSSVTLTWDPSSESPVDFRYYVVRRSLDGNTYTELTRITDQAAPLYVDYAAPIGRTLYYRVAQANLDLESDPAEAETALDAGCFFLVTPGAPEASFELPNVTDYVGEFPMQSVEHEPIGRPRKLVETGLLLGEEGSVVAVLMPEDDPAVLDMLRAAASGSSSEVLLKTPYGEVFAVVVGTIRRERQSGGRQSVSFRFVSV